MDNPATHYRIRFRNGGYDSYDKCSAKSKWVLRAIVDNDIQEARAIPESKRTAEEQMLAEQAIYFVDDEGNFDDEKIGECLALSSSLLVPEECRLFEEMRKNPTLDSDTVCLSPSKAVSALLESQNQTFGEAEGTDSGFLLTRLDTTELDNLTTYSEIKKKVDQVSRALLEETIAETDFDMDMKMVDIREDDTMESLVNEIVGDGSDLSGLGDYETTTVQVAMKMVLILAEKAALLGLVSGRMRTYKRKNGRFAIWGNLPKWLRKFYCIGMARRWKLTSRTSDYNIPEEHEYLVSPILNPMPRGTLWRKD